MTATELILAPRVAIKVTALALRTHSGKYGFFVIPNEEEWTIIFNTNWDQHGKDEYDEKDDVLQFKVTPKISEEVQEHLEYKIIKTSDVSGTMSLSWEKVVVEFPFEVN